MCRLLGVVAERPAPIADLLAEVLPAFLELSVEHADGWGLSYRRPDGTLEIVKGIGPACKSEKLKAQLADCVTDMALVHLRMASPGSLVTESNTHPFGDSQVAFAHNGEFFPGTCVDPLIDRSMLSRARGDTDSERYYLTVRERIGSGAGPDKAIVQAAADIRYQSERYASLNCLLLTPDALIAYADHDPQSAVIRRRGEDFFALRHRTYRGRTIVASQGWPQPEPTWTRLPERAVLSVPRGGEGEVVLNSW